MKRKCYDLSGKGQQKEFHSSSDSSNYSSYKNVKMTPRMMLFLAMLITSPRPALEEESE